MKKITKILTSIAMAAAMVSTAAFSDSTSTLFPNTAITAEAYASGCVTGCFQSNPHKWTGFTTIRSADPSRKSKIRIETYDMWGWRSNAIINLEVYSLYGEYIGYCTKFKTSRNLNLPAGYDGYRIKIAAHNFGNGWIEGANDFDNMGKCVYWCISAKDNCRL